MEITSLFFGALGYLWPEPLTMGLAAATLIVVMAGWLGPLKGVALAKEAKPNRQHLTRQAMRGDPTAQLDLALLLLKDGKDFKILKESFNWLERAYSYLGMDAVIVYLKEFLNLQSDGELPKSFTRKDGTSPFSSGISSMVISLAAQIWMSSKTGPKNPPASSKKKKPPSSLGKPGRGPETPAEPKGRYPEAAANQAAKKLSERAAIELNERMKALARSAEAGNAKAQYQLALAYEIGSGVPQSHEEYLRWMKRAAASGLAEAVNTLALEVGD